MHAPLLVFLIPTQRANAAQIATQPGGVAWDFGADPLDGIRTFTPSGCADHEEDDPIEDIATEVLGYVPFHEPVCLQHYTHFLFCQALEATCVQVLEPDDADEAVGPDLADLAEYATLALRDGALWVGGTEHDNHPIMDMHAFATSHFPAQGLERLRAAAMRSGLPAPDAATLEHALGRVVLGYVYIPQEESAHAALARTQRLREDLALYTQSLHTGPNPGAILITLPG